MLAAFTYAFAALVLYVGVGLMLGGLIWGFDPLISLSGSEISVGRSLSLIGGSVLVYFLPTLAVASLAILLSTVTRNSAAAVVATLMLSLIMQLLGIISALDFLRPYLLPGAVQRLAGPAARADRLGAGDPGRVGLSAVRRAGAVLGVHALPAARCRRRLSSALSIPHHVIHRGLIRRVRARSVPLIMGQVMFARRGVARALRAGDLPRP